ncbi:hypothetical protein BOX15_Mlig016768g3 [Macrostomum lignano]|uniref:Uncharacterized protein n=1 Tax=Macrostomum lignano TaxID=282301 RepID=A0A267GHR9_9PLAT|nr:hypothetical protein BOX15_Mlig016768g3 [Macrostomum lignano]
MQNGNNCLYNPRYSDCLKEMLLQSLLLGDQSQRLFDRHGCQGPIVSDDSGLSAIDGSQLVAMRTGWDNCSGPYPAFRVEHRATAGPLLTQKNLLTVMRARRLGPLRVRAGAPAAAATPAEQSPAPTSSRLEVQTPPPDSCATYRDRKDQQRFVAASSIASLRRSLPILPPTVASSVDSVERDGPVVLRKQLTDRNGSALMLETDVASSTATHVHVGPVNIIEPDELSLSFNYNRFRERLSRWEAAAEAAVVAASPISSAELLRLSHRQPAPGLQIRSVVVSDRSVAASVPSSTGGGGSRSGGGIKSRRPRQVKSNQRR